MNALQVEVCRIILIQKSRCQIRDVLACIALSSEINLVALHAKGLDEASPEIIELVRDIDFILDGRWTGRETGTRGLINVDHIGQVCP